MSDERQASPPDTKRHAYACLQAGKLEGARELFDQTCRLHPTDAEAWFMQGAVNGQLGDTGVAEACFRRAAQLQPDRPEIHFNLAKALEAQGRVDAALQCYGEAVRLKPDLFGAHAQIANLLESQGRLEEALASQRETVRLAPDAAQSHYNLGNILKKLGRHGEAETAYREALKINPTLAEAWHNLGIVLREQDRTAEAAQAYHEALRLNPNLSAAHLSQGNLLYGQGHLPEAEGAYRRALALKPDYDEAQNNLGGVLLEQHHLDEAAECFQAVLDRGPNAVSHCNLGNVRLRQQRLEEAVGHYREALALEPGYAEAHHNLGNALRQQGRPAEAQTAYRRALELEPGYADAHIGLGTVLAEGGKLEQALACYERALELEPEAARIISGKASILEKQGKFEQAFELLRPLLEGEELHVNAVLVFAALCRPLSRCAEAISLMERLLDDREGAVDVYDRALLQFTLGRLLDAAGEYDRAFAHYQQGNTLAKRRFDLQGHVRRIEGLMAAYAPSFMARAPRATRRSQRPVFIVGMPRSGTSLAEQILASHPAVYGAGELEEIGQIVIDLPGTLGTAKAYPQCLEDLTAEHLDALAGRYLEHIGILAPPDAPRVTDKMPINFLHLGLIALLFPEARIIHCVRDPMDTCLSCYFQHFAEGQPYTYDLAQLGGFHRQYQRLMEHWRTVLDVPMLELRYEDLVTDQQGVSRGLVEFCGLEWDERCLRFHETQRVVATASYDQVRQPLYNRSVGRWRHYEAHLGPLRKSLSEPSVYETSTQARETETAGEGESAAKVKKQQAYDSLQAGDWKQAELLYAQACRLDPEDAEAHYNLGTVAKELGHYEEAEAAYRNALRLRPDAVAALHNMGTVLAELNRLDDAARYYEAAIAQKPNAMSYSNLGNLYTRQQRLDEAIGQYRQALALAPDIPEVYNNLATALRRRGRYQDALAACEQAVRLRPEYGEAYINLGGILLHLRRMEEARDSYRRARELLPDSPQTVAGEASVLETQGDFEQSYECLRPFLETGEAEVNMALVLASLARPLGRSEEAVTLLERVLAGTGADAPGIYDRILVHFTLGRLLDADGEYDRAFHHYRQGNILSNQRFDPHAHEAYVDALIETYSTEFMARAPRAAHRSARPVFVVGMPRSGTSLVEQILASHPQLFGAGELGEIYAIVTDLPALVQAQAPYPHCVTSLTGEHCERLARRYLDYIEGLAPPEARRITDKMPTNFLHLGLINQLFPQARIIHCMRDPLDTCLSCYFQNFAEGHPYSYDLAHLGAFYDQYRRLMAHWRTVLDMPLMEICYEDLVADQENVTRALVEFCGLDWDERCLRFHETGRVIATASYDQVRQPLYKHSAGRWRHYERHLGPLREALATSRTSAPP